MNQADCPKNMKAPIEILEMHVKHASWLFNDGVPHEERNRRRIQIKTAISILKAHEGQCQCGSMPGDENAALWDLGHSLSVHHDFLKIYQGTPKGDYHARCIREIEQAIQTLKSTRIEELRKERDSLVADRDSLATRAGKMWKFLNALKHETVADAAMIEQHGTQADQDAARMARAAVARIEEAMR